MTETFPETLTEALDKIPSSYEVAVRRISNGGGWWVIAKRNQNGGAFTAMSGTHPLWQEAFAEIWKKI